MLFFTRHYSVSIYHYSGTTAMGPRGSPHAVVDPELRVIGTKRLRVIDAGIMPTVVCKMQKTFDGVKYFVVILAISAVF